MLIIFESNFDQDQARRIVGPDLDPNCDTHNISEVCFLKNIVS